MGNVGIASQRRLLPIEATEPQRITVTKRMRVAVKDGAWVVDADLMPYIPKQSRGAM